MRFDLSGKYPYFFIILYDLILAFVNLLKEKDIDIDFVDYDDIIKIENCDTKFNKPVNINHHFLDKKELKQV